MDTEHQISERELRGIGAAYASVCLERPLPFYSFTDWRGEQARRLALSRERLVEEFDASHETSLDDLVGLELAECYRAYDGKDYEAAAVRMERAVAHLLRGLRHVRSLMDSNG